MKNNFQSKSVPRGTRTIWRYLSALFLLFTFAIGNVLADTELCSASISDITATANTTGVAQTGCTMKWNAVTTTASDIVTISGVNYRKFTGSGSYVQLILTSGNFQEGDVLTVILAGKDSGKKTVEFSLKADDGNSASGSASKTVTDAVAYTLTAGDIETDGSIKIFRHGSSNSRYGSFSVVRPAGCTETAPISVAVSGGATYDKGDALSNLSAAVTGGTGTMSYQWYRNTTNSATISDDLKLANCTTATLTPANKVGTYYYYCVASNCAGSVTSNTTAVTINADCSATGDIFTLTMNLENAPTSEVKTPASSTMNIDKYINIDGGDIILATGSSQHSSITTTPRIKLGGSSGYAQITLDCPWQEGDIITFEKTNKIALAADAGGTNKIQLASGTNEYTITKEDCLYNQSNLFVLRDGNNVEISSITITRPVYRTITLEYADGVTPDGSLKVIDGEKAAKPADPTWAHHRFDGWYNGASPYDWTATVSGDLTLTAHWTQLYTVTYAKGDEGATGDAPTQADKAATETFKVAANTFELAGKVFDHWNDGTADYNPEDTYTVGTSNVTLTAVWRTPSTMYAITKGTHTNGDFTIDPASQEAGEVVTLEATPDEDYLFSAWEVVKTEDGSATGITVDANGQFTMPAYAVTVNATFTADPRTKVLYVTSNTADATKANDKLYDALKDIYNVKIVGPTSDADQSGYALVVLHESVGGGDYDKTAVAAAKAGDVPVLNTKSYFYNSGRFGWGTPNAGQSVKGATLNNAYCNIADHPLFSGVTVTDGFFEITDDAAAKCMQPVGSFTSGKEGYTLATTPNADSGNGAAIHELTPAQRGASAGKYLLISVSNAKLDALNANGQKLFQNAAAYLVDGSASWAPISVPTAAEVTATPSENYTEGNTITLTASATGTTASTTYTWYKGADWATASATTPVQAAATDGNVFTKTAALEDAGTYWCNISNGTSCDVQASVTITVSSASTPTHAIIYDNTKGADMTAYPTEYTEGVGVASFAALADIDGWHFVEWSPASIAADATTDQTITAVWAQVFEVTFDLQGHGAAIAAQNIVSGGKVTKPDDPIAIGWDFGGWFTDAVCTAGNEWDFDNDVVSAATPLFAKWTAFDGCAVLVPATSGSTLNAGDAVDLQTGSTGGSIKALTANLSYDVNGLLFGDNSSTKVEVTLTHLMKEGTVITAIIYNADASKARGLNLLNSNGTSKATWTKTQAGDHVETYTVVADDGLDGSNVFQLQRNQNAYLKELKVSNCGTELIFHNLTSVVDPVGKGTVTLDANSVPEGHTTKATYSAIDPLYEFVSWSVSGAGASIDNATANPVTVTMGTEDAVITLNLQVKPVKYTVNYYDGATAMGTEEVSVNEHPTASEIATAKRGYIFEGWAMSSTATASDVVALNTITSDVEATINLYAVYTEIPCPTEGTVFSMVVTDPAGTEYEGNNEFNLEIGATYVGGKAYSGSKNSTKRVGVINANGEYSFENAGDVTVKIAMDCALQEGDVITFTTSTTRELKIQKVAGTDLVTTSGKKYVIPAASPLIGEYDFYLERGNSQSTMKTFNVYRPAVLMGVTLSDAVVAIDSKVTPVMTLAPTPDAYVSSQVWSIEGAGEGTIANIDPSTGEVTGVAIGSVTVKVVLNGSIENTCTVTVIDSYTQVAVTETSEWNFAGAAAASSKINFPNSTEEFLLANISGVNNTPEFNSRALVVKGKYVSNSQLQAQTIRFNVTTSGKLTIRFACTSDKGEGNNRELYINGVATGAVTYNGEVTYTQAIPGGEVAIKALYDKESVLTEDIMNYKYIKFDVTPDVSDADYTRDVTEGRYGTICLPNGGIIVGADIFELAYYGATSQKFFFDEIASAEMEAGKPYLFFPHEGATQLGVYYTDSENKSGLTVNGFVGFIGADADAYTQVPANDNCYIISNNLYRQVQTGAEAYILSNRAYIDMTKVTNVEPAKAPGARRIGLGVQGKDQAQGFENIETGDAPMKVMINGTMYILRGEKVYDATGRLVK